jgi:uncharacterized protein YbaA (DUF1428 family)
MAAFADVYLLPIPKRNLAAYRTLARRFGRLCMDHGAVEYREYVGNDLNMKGAPGLVPFTKLVKLGRGEMLIYAAVTFKSKAERDRINKRVANDPRVKALMPNPALFDMKRMVVGGFSRIVDL